MASITDFAARFQGGVSANLFKVHMTAPGIYFEELQFLVKAASLPGQTIGVIDVPFRGRQLKVPGDRTFEDWEVTMLNDPNFQNRAAIEQWMTRITASSANYSQYDRNNTDYYGQASVSQLDRQQDVIRTYRMQVLPTSIGAITVDMGENDAVEEFPITFAVNTMVIDGQGVDASVGGSGVDISVSGSLNIGPVQVNLGI